MDDTTHRVNACLIGVSGFADFHYRGLLRQVERGRVSIIGATVINQEEEREKCAILRGLGCRVFEDYREMLSAVGRATDLCVIPTGIQLHADMTCDALAAGANVLVEKPAAATIEDVRRMQAAETEANRFVAVGFQTMYAPETVWMKRTILEGRIGRVRIIKCLGMWPRPQSYYRRNPWAGSLRIGSSWVLDSPFNNALAHQLNMMCFLAGTEQTESAELFRVRAELYRARAIEGPDTACLRLTTTEGIPILFLVTHSSESKRNPEIVVEGSEGSLHWTFEEAWVEDLDGAREVVECQKDERLHDTMMDAILRRLRDGQTFICGLRHAAVHTQAVNAAHKASHIHPIDPAFVRRVGVDGSALTIVDGLDEAMEQALEEEKLLSELPISWARPGKPIELTRSRESAKV